MNEMPTSIAEKLLRFDKRIRFAAIVDERGHIISGGMKEGVQPVEPLEKTPMIISQLISRETAEARAEFLGRPKYSVFVHEGLVAMVLHKGAETIVVTMERNFPFTKLPEISRMVLGSSK